MTMLLLPKGNKFIFLLFVSYFTNLWPWHFSPFIINLPEIHSWRRLDTQGRQSTYNVELRWFCGPSLAGVVGSNPRRVHGSLSVKLSDRGLYDELITRPEESYRLWCVVECDLETLKMRRSWPALDRSATEVKKNPCEADGSCHVV